MLYFKIENLFCIKRCGRYSENSGWNHRGKKIANNLLVLLESGECSFRIGSKTYELECGDVIIVPKNTWYAPHTRRGCSYQYFQFVAEETAAADGERLYGNMATGYRYCDTLPLVDQVFALPQKCRASSQVKGYLSDAIHEMLSDYSESNIKMNLCFLSALVQLCESAKLERESLADRVKRYINKYKFEPISLADISAHFGYTKQHLVRIFLGKFGYSPTEYIERRRLEHAATLLSDGNSKISEIATKCGFEDANYFTRRFRKFFGTTPREYRDSARKYAFNVINEYDYST